MLDLRHARRFADRLGPGLINGAAGTFTSVLGIRPNGVEVVLAGNGRAYTQGRSLGPNAIFGTLAPSDDWRKVYAQDVGHSPASVTAFDVDYLAIAGGS